jgi:CubicO group peptidase (beta-lactamase class C family)
VRPRYRVVLGFMAAFVLVSLVGRAPRARAGDLPESGRTDPRFEPFDRAVRHFMAEHGISAGALAVRMDDRVVYQRGYGWKDEAKTKPVPPDALFRIASLTKPITASAVKMLIRRGKLSADSKVFRGLALKPPPGATSDPRLASITVDQLIHHKGGWDKATAGDPTWDVGPISKALGLDRAPKPAEIASYMLGQPLQFDPGSRSAYSNLGYMLLGLVIEKVTGTTYHAAVQTLVWKPLGVRDAVAARSLKKDGDPREVWYESDRKVKSAVDSASSDLVPRAYGGFVLEHRAAVGGWAISAASYARFMEVFDVNGDPYSRGATWTFNGGQPGVCSTAIWRKDGMKVVAFFNKEISNSKLADELKAAADKVMAGATAGAR